MPRMPKFAISERHCRRWLAADSDTDARKSCQRNPQLMTHQHRFVDLRIRGRLAGGEQSPS